MPSLGRSAGSRSAARWHPKRAAAAWTMAQLLSVDQLSRMCRSQPCATQCSMMSEQMTTSDGVIRPARVAGTGRHRSISSHPAASGWLVRQWRDWHRNLFPASHPRRRGRASGRCRSRHRRSASGRFPRAGARPGDRFLVERPYHYVLQTYRRNRLLRPAPGSRVEGKAGLSAPVEVPLLPAIAGRWSRSSGVLQLRSNNFCPHLVKSRSCGVACHIQCVFHQPARALRASAMTRGAGLPRNRRAAEQSLSARHIAAAVAEKPANRSRRRTNRGDFFFHGRNRDR
jgi:hypothetical protein